MTTITFARAAEIMNLKSTRITAAERARARLTALFGTTCAACGGDGSYGMMTSCGSTHCFECGGDGLIVTNVTEEMAAEAKALTDGGALEGYFAQAKLKGARLTQYSALGMGRAVAAIFTEIAAFAAAREPSCVAIESSHATACVKMNEIRRTGRAAEIRRFGVANRSYEVWAL